MKHALILHIFIVNPTSKKTKGLTSKAGQV